MTARVEAVLQQAQELSEEERVELAAELLATLVPGTASADRTSAEWISEVERRAKDALAGAPGVPWLQARAEIESRIRKQP